VKGSVPEKLGNVFKIDEPRIRDHPGGVGKRDCAIVFKLIARCGS